MPKKNDNVIPGESSISKEKPIEDTFAAIPDPEEIDSVISEIEAETIPEMLGLEGSGVEITEDEPENEETTDKIEPEIEGQINLTNLPIPESETPVSDSDAEELSPIQATNDATDKEDTETSLPEQLTMNIDDEPEELPKKKSEDRYDPKKPRRIDSVFEFVELIIFTFLAVMIVSAFFFRHAEVRGSSMEKTLNDGDHLIISNFLYTPERGDIVVCSYYSSAFRDPIVKRVIGIAGDVIKIDESGNVIVNGTVLDEPYVYINSAYSGYTEGEWTVPEGEVFVMGDHRNVSGDSRSFGTVKVDCILGKVLLRFYPLDKFGTVE